MRYSIAIKGMHCAGCAGLVAMSLEEAGLAHADVSLEKAAAAFESAAPAESVKKMLDAAFADLAGYAYADLRPEQE